MLPVLVAKHPCEEDEFFVAVERGERIHQRVDALGIVRAVNDEVRPAAQELEPSGPLGVGKPLVNGLVRELVPAARAQRAAHVDDRQRVQELILAEKPQVVRPAAAVFELLTVERGRNALKLFLRGDRESHVLLRALFARDVLHTLALAEEHGVCAVLDDAAFLRGDLLDRVAENGRVLQADVRHDADLRRGDDVCRVHAPAEADLKRDDVALLLHEVEEGDGRHDLKARGHFAHALRRVPHGVCERNEGVVVDLFPVHAHALVEAQQVRRGIEPRAVPRALEHGGEHRGGRALAVRARDVDEFELLLGIAEQTQKLARARKARRALLPVVELQIFEGLLNGLQVFHIVHLYFL